MAGCARFECSKCKNAVEAWDDGNPYYYDNDGVKQYAYHPDHERLALCIGNDVPHICLDCGEQFNVDSNAPVMKCPKCGAPRVTCTTELEGITCPFCHDGILAMDPDFFAIS